MVLNTEELLQEIQHLKEHLEEYKDILDAIKNGEVDALAINRNGKADIFSMQSTDFVYRILVENFGEGALNISEEGFIIYANPAFEKLITGSPSTLIGKDIEDYIDIDSIKEFKSLFKKSFSGTSSGEIYLHINGKKIPVYISLRSLYPNFPSIGMVVTNLTAHKNHEKEISGFKAQLSAKDEALLQAEIMQKSNEKFRLMTDSMPQKVWISDEKGAVEYFNKQWLDYSGHSIDELKKLGWRNLLHPDDLTETEKRWSEALENNEPYEIEHRFLQHDGSYKWHLSRAIPQKDDTGKVVSWVGTNTDIDAQKNFRQQLELNVSERTIELSAKNKELNTQKEFIETILNASQDAIAVLDRDHKYIMVNKKTEQLLSGSSETLIGSKAFLEDVALEKNISEALKGKMIISEPYFSPILKRWFEPYFVPLKNKEDQTYQVVVVARDIHEIVESAREIEDKNKRLTLAQSFLKQLIDSSVEIIMAVDMNLNFITVNKKYLDLKQLTFNEIFGKNIFEIIPEVKDTYQHECILKALNGETVHLDKRKGISVSALYVDTYFIPLILDKKVSGVIIMSRDITDIVRYEKELEKKNVELEKSNKELESFNYIASHDLQEPLRQIQMLTGLIQNNFAQSLPEKCGSYLEKIEKASFRMRNLINALLNYSRISESNFSYETVDLNSMVQYVKKNLEEKITQQEVSIVSEPLPVIQGLPFQLEQLFQNLFENSIKYIHPGVKPAINITCTTLNEIELPGKPVKDYWKIEISDNGIGFDMKYASKIFEVFQRLHSREAFEGTGIGLAICKKIIDNHGGTLKAFSEPEVGTTFEILLPKSLT